MNATVPTSSIEISPDTLRESAEIGSGSRCALSWMSADGLSRFHIWMHPDTFEDEGILYKNPPRGVEVCGPDDWPTRKLDTSAMVNAPTVYAVKKYAKEANLVDRARVAIKRKRDRQAEEQAAAARLHKIKEAGPAMLKVLKRIAAHDHITGCGRQLDHLFNTWIDDARAVTEAATQED